MLKACLSLFTLLQKDIKSALEYTVTKSLGLAYQLQCAKVFRDGFANRSNLQAFVFYLSLEACSLMSYACAAGQKAEPAGVEVHCES